MTFHELISMMFSCEPMDSATANEILRRILLLFTRRPYRRLPPGRDPEAKTQIAK